MGYSNYWCAVVPACVLVLEAGAWDLRSAHWSLVENRDGRDFDVLARPGIVYNRAT